MWNEKNAGTQHNEKENGARKFIYNDRWGFVIIVKANNTACAEQKIAYQSMTVKCGVHSP